MIDDSVNSVRLAIEILKSLSEGNCRVTDISDALKISKSTAHRLLKTLEGTGIVSQEPTNRTYHPGKLLIQLAYPLISSHQKLIEAASEQMRWLRKLTGETTILYIKYYKEAICIEELPSFRPIKFTFGKGNTMPWNVGAATKVLLAQLTDIQAEKILKTTQFEQYTPKTNTSKDRLIDLVREARVNGYATSSGTYEQGTAAVAVPIVNYLVPAALSILGSEKEFGPKIPSFIPKMRESAEKIARELAMVI
jgi:DNA-binding IclR family transcriptional regulator